MLLNNEKRISSMEYSIISLIKAKKGTIILTGVLIAALSFLFVVVSQKNFKASTDFLVVQDKDGEQDYYSLSKSAEYIGKILSEAVYSDLFIDEVIKTKKVSGEFLPFDKKARIEQWNKIVKVTRNPEVSMLSVTVYGNNREDSVKITEAISQVLTTKSYLFRGSGQNIDVRILSGPIVEKNPSLENIILVILGGFIVGALLSTVLLFYRPKKTTTDFIVNNKRSVGYRNIPEPEEYEESLRYLNK